MFAEPEYWVGISKTAPAVRLNSGQDMLIVWKSKLIKVCFKDDFSKAAMIFLKICI